MSYDSRIIHLKRLYRPVEPLFRYLGLHTYVKQGYDALERWIQPDKVSVNVGGATATFATPTQGEYRRMTTMLEQDIIADVLDRLQPSDVFWDIGASTGPFACLVADTLDAGSVIAFEPHPGNIEGLRRNIHLNGYDNVTAKQIVLSDKVGDINFAISSREAGTGLHAINVSEDRENISVPTQRGDELVQEGLPHPTVVKIDVEGSEPLVVDGMREMLSDERCRLVYCEVHGDENHPNSIRRYDTTPAAFCELIESLGFDITVINDGTTFTLRGEKR